MQKSPRKLSHFWQELKRRKVIKTLAMYAGAAYILIELANNVVEPLQLPDWTPRLVILLVVVGFPVVAVLSRIFDITSEGIKKTEQAAELEEDEIPQVNPRRKFSTSDGIIVLLILIICLLIYPKVFNVDQFEEFKDEDGHIAIAVMPYENLTGDSTLNWFQRGISSLIINGLAGSPEFSDHPLPAITISFERNGAASTSCPLKSKHHENQTPPGM